MTDTERIINLLDINEEIPSIVSDDDGNIISGNKIFYDHFPQFKRGEQFSSLFDKNTQLLIKNCFIDAKIFLKIQRKDIKLSFEDKFVELKLIISPFKLDTKIYFFILLFNESYKENLLVYPSLDDNGISTKYRETLNNLKESLPKSLIDKKNLQYSIDIEKEPLGIRDKVQFLFTNNSFNNIYNIKSNSKAILSVDDIFPKQLLSKVIISENEVYNTNSLFVIEKKAYTKAANQQNDRILLSPIFSSNGMVECIFIVGAITFDDLAIQMIEENEEIKTEVDSSKEITIETSDNVQIIYDKNNFDILDANEAASQLYNYDLDELKSMNITNLFLPEDMQKLLMPPNENGKFIFKHIDKNGRIIDVNVDRENIIFNEVEAYKETISINQPEEEVIELEEYEEKDVAKVETVLESSFEAESEIMSDFLSSLFHELLTPVNVILGFVQEIIDSIDNPSDEQAESAQIIKDNQAVLLHSMNTAVQYAQLHENKLPTNIESFDIKNYLVDLQDSFSRITDKNNVNVIFDNIPETIPLTHDRAKLLAAISYFVKFIIKLTDSPKIFVSFKNIDENIYILVEDSEKGISPIVASNLLEMFNSVTLNDKKNFGISSITLSLAKKLNEMLSVNVTEYVAEDGKKSLAFITPKVFEANQKTRTSDPAKHSISEDQTIIETEEEKIEPISPELTSDHSASDILGDDVNGKIDEQIIEDIEDEEEIVTEEIATVSKTIDNTSTNISDLSCLFIDDNLDTQLLFKSQMKDFNLLKVCSNLTEALPLLEKYNFDVIVVDVNLNDAYNGLDALKIIRQFNDYSSVPIIAVTAYSFEGDKEKFINFGFTDYFVKPLLREQLLNSLEAILQ